MRRLFLGTFLLVVFSVNSFANSVVIRSTSVSEDALTGLNWFTGDTKTEERLRRSLSILSLGDTSKKGEAIFVLTKEVEHLGRSQVRGVYNEEDSQRQSAKSFLEKVLLAKEASGISAAVKGEIRGQLERRFLPPSLVTSRAAYLEAQRRASESVVAKGTQQAAQDKAIALERFRILLGDSIQKAGTTDNLESLWNLTKTAFNVLEKELGGSDRPLWGHLENLQKVFYSMEKENEISRAQSRYLAAIAFARTQPVAALSEEASYLKHTPQAWVLGVLVFGLTLLGVFGAFRLILWLRHRETKQAVHTTKISPLLSSKGL